jgi:hypothetical protein
MSGKISVGARPCSSRLPESWCRRWFWLLIRHSRTPGSADPTLLKIFNDAIAGADDRAAVLSGGVFFGEGRGFHAIGVPTIGYLPAPQYLCAMATDGEISKLDSKHFHDQVVVTVKCLLAMQQATGDQLKGATSL